MAKIADCLRRLGLGSILLSLISATKSYFILVCELASGLIVPTLIWTQQTKITVNIWISAHLCSM